MYSTLLNKNRALKNVDKRCVEYHAKQSEQQKQSAQQKQNSVEQSAQLGKPEKPCNTIRPMSLIGRKKEQRGIINLEHQERHRRRYFWETNSLRI